MYYHTLRNDNAQDNIKNMSTPLQTNKDANGSYTGFDLDLAKEVCQRNNWTFKAQPVGWDAKDSQLNSGSIDCIWNGFIIDGMENDYALSNPYFDN